MIFDIDLFNILDKLAQTGNHHRGIAIVQVQHPDRVIAPIDKTLWRIEKNEVFQSETPDLSHILQYRENKRVGCFCLLRIKNVLLRILEKNLLRVLSVKSIIF